DVVRHALVALEGRHARGLYRGDVDEAVLAAVFRLDEAVALVGIEEFDCADRHGVFLSRTRVFPGRNIRTRRGRASGRQSKGVRRRDRAIRRRTPEPGAESVEIFDVSLDRLAQAAAIA